MPVKYPVLRLWAINVLAALLQIAQKRGNKAAVFSQAGIKHNDGAINTQKLRTEPSVTVKACACKRKTWVMRYEHFINIIVDSQEMP